MALIQKAKEYGNILSERNHPEWSFVKVERKKVLLEQASYAFGVFESVGLEAAVE